MAGEETAKKIDREIIEMITKPVPKTATDATTEDILRAQKYLDKNGFLQPGISNADLLYQGAQRAQASQMDQASLMREYARRGMNPNDLAGQLAAQQFGMYQTRELNPMQEEALREFAKRIAGESVKIEANDVEIIGILSNTTYEELFLAFYRSPYNDFKGFLWDYISSRVRQYRDSRNETKAEKSRDSSQDETPRVILEE